MSRDWGKIPCICNCALLCAEKFNLIFTLLYLVIKPICWSPVLCSNIVFRLTWDNIFGLGRGFFPVFFFSCILTALGSLQLYYLELTQLGAHLNCYWINVFYVRACAQLARRLAIIQVVYVRSRDAATTSTLLCVWCLCFAWWNMTVRALREWLVGLVET